MNGMFNNSGWLIGRNLLHSTYIYYDDSGKDKKIFENHRIPVTFLERQEGLTFEGIELPGYTYTISKIRVPTFYAGKVELALALIHELQTIKTSNDIAEYRRKHKRWRQ